MPDLILERYMTRDVFPLETLGPGTYTKTLEIRGNAILSSVYINSIDVGASVEVKYFQTTTGTPAGGERYDLNSHAPLTTTGTDQIAVTRVHNKPVIEVTVAGGNVEFGVYLTVNDELATDIDAALVSDGQTANLANDKGIPIACYNETTGLWEIIRCPIPVSIDGDANVGDRFSYQFNNVSTPGTEQALINEATHATLITSIRRLRVSCRNHGAWELLAGGVILASGLTGPATPNDDYVFDIPEQVAVSTNLRLNYLAHSGQGACKLDAFVQTTRK